MSKHYIYGSGMRGCLYDFGPHAADNIDAAIESIASVFVDCIDDDEMILLRKNLKKYGIHHFNNTSEAGAQYADITEHDGPIPDEFNED